MQITPMTPKESMDSFFASSSMFSCSGVRFSSTYMDVNFGMNERNVVISTYLLHHGENYAEFRLRARSNNNSRPSTFMECK